MLALAAHNADLDAENKHGVPPAALAAYAGQLEVVQALAARNAKCKCKELGWHDSHG